MRLIAENLSAKRGESLLFQGLSFEVAKNQALVVTGPNGSGKSTLLRVVAGLLAPEDGVVRITNTTATIARASEACHYLGHRNAMKRELTVRENLSFWQSYMGNFGDSLGISIDEATENVGLAGISHLPFGFLSAGQQRRMAIAKLLVAWRPVWLLDEPTAALDVSADEMFAGLVKAHLSAGGIVIAATHQPLGFADFAELKMTGFVDEEAGW